MKNLIKATVMVSGACAVFVGWGVLASLYTPVLITSIAGLIIWLILNYKSFLDNAEKGA